VLLAIKLDLYGVLNVLKLSKNLKNRFSKKYVLICGFLDGIVVLLVGVH
jgi:hypothetical protein